MAKQQLFDNHGRKVNYLRLAVTDRCNLRCFYCMPEEGIQYVPRKELMTYEEMERIIRLMMGMGIEKLRITGGEPFVRKGMLRFMYKMSKLGLKKFNITTNGTVTAPLVPDLKKMGISSVNLSLDTLDRDRFFKITRRDVFPKVMESLEALLKAEIPTKINAVVMEGKILKILFHWSS
jgi:molybdenum cofactor biosynthesis enzyme MoaA